MSTVVADTHAVLWHLLADERSFHTPGKQWMAPRTRAIRYLSPRSAPWRPRSWLKRKRIEANALTRSEQVLGWPDSAFQAMPLTADIAFGLAHIPRALVADLPDRIIAATALAMRLLLVTRDGKIRASGIATIWQLRRFDRFTINVSSRTCVNCW